ncbi:MAG: ATP-dependent 6-phosphofructokinase, partial [Proteobacteria bacterium]|nr:ATP-dependent 6-phosphofructokinase [Pseudomonadota bacterium]
MTKASFRRIGVLTSGGDCAGLNAAIRAVVKRAVHGFSAEVLGILDSTEGLLASPPRIRPLSLEVFSGEALRSGGTMLGTVNKGDPFRYPMPDGGFADRSDEVVRALRDLGIEGLIGIGGDGSMKILHAIMEKAGLPFIGIPKTIDNDVPLTEFAIGFHTAVGVAVEALDRLQPTAASHHRVMILETMGRGAGHIALSAGIAGGADVILIPEIPYDIDAVARHLADVHDKEGRNHALVVCAEAARPKDGVAVTRDDRYGGVGEKLGRGITAATGADTRVTVLGHVQRGGQPSSFDR